MGHNCFIFKLCINPLSNTGSEARQCKISLLGSVIRSFWDYTVLYATKKITNPIGSLYNDVSNF